MSECHAGHCSEPATVRVKLGNDHSFKDRWTAGIDYCDSHGNKVGCASSDRGMRVLIEDIGIPAWDEEPALMPVRLVPFDEDEVEA